ncbi:ABC transporter permease [Pseudoxanthomonas sangjuensis]|uniref:ABC transporter permease n=1 Tax=Pseudoxanthomonas sangjuensis TaxID=1503750 RepID=UPI001391840A|nr:ABC transporter permease [Pseudoxanthomonas sangjuensis]KAF1707901.1 ABC transporter permease [Pseudoxanthomonas sangjuensis]
MNAVVVNKSKFDTFKWLLKREFWENRGGFLWSQLITGAVVAGLTLIGAVLGGVKINGHFVDDFHDVDTEAGAHAIGQFIEGVVSMGMGISLLVLTFVVFFYTLGALFDERKDRSVLFWKSMPVSDAATVLSKLAWALLLAPLLAILLGAVLGLVLWLIAALGIAISGLGMVGFTAMFTDAHVFRLIGSGIAALPVYVAWALPTVGWLLFVSSWARSKPFLWAVLVPVLGCASISLISLILGLDLPLKELWSTIVGRGLGSAVPGIWSLWYGHDAIVTGDAKTSIIGLYNFVAHSWHAFSLLNTWIGAVVGAGFIFAAIHLRRWRELAD